MSDSCMVDSCNNKTYKSNANENLKMYSVNDKPFILFRIDMHKNINELGTAIFSSKEEEELEKMARSPKPGCSCLKIRRKPYNSYPDETYRKTHRIKGIAIPVLEFSRGEYKLRKIFG